VSAGQSVSPPQVVVRISNFKVRPKTGIYDNRNASVQFEVDVSDPSAVVGAVARIRQVAAPEVQQGQTLPGFISFADITASNVVGNRLRVLMTVKLPLGRNQLAFSLGSRATAAQATQGGKTVTATQVQSNEVGFLLKSGVAPSEPSPPPPPPPPTGKLPGPYACLPPTPQPGCPQVFGPVRPVYAAISLAFVVGLVLNQFAAGWRVGGRRPRR
jgi:hypothetical protein